jgi:hypothetical protein
MNGPLARARAYVGVLTLLFLAGPGFSQDWPQWRGPNRDGAVQGVKVPTKWPKAWTEQWKVEAGEGVSSPVVAGGRVYVLTRQKEDELVLCFDLAGKELWRSEPSPAPMNGAWGKALSALGRGPRLRSPTDECTLWA